MRVEIQHILKYEQKYNRSINAFLKEIAAAEYKLNEVLEVLAIIQDKHLDDLRNEYKTGFNVEKVLAELINAINDFYGFGEDDVSGEPSEKK